MEKVCQPPTVVEIFHSFRAQERHQLTLTAGEKLTVIDKDPSGWWIGRNAKGVVGIFPSTYARAVSNSAPSAEVTRELIAARVATELGLYGQGAGGGSPSTKQGAKSLSDGFIFVSDIDNDDVFAMTPAEVEKELRALVKDRDRLHRESSALLSSVVDQSIQIRKMSTEVTVNATAQSEKQKLTIGRRRLDELINQEKLLQEEYDELQCELRRKSIPMPQCLTSAASCRDERAGSEASPAASPMMATAPAVGPVLSEDESWLNGVQSETLVQFCKGLQRTFQLENEFLDRQEAELEKFARQLKELEGSVAQKHQRAEHLSELRDRRCQDYLQKLTSAAEAAKAEYERVKNGVSGQALIQSLSEDEARLTAQIEAAKAEYAQLMSVIEVLSAKKEELVSRSGRRGELEEQLRAAEALEEEERTIEAATDAQLAELRKTMAEELAVYKQLERRRRETYNKIQELKGNLRVYCRVKPIGKGESNECVEVLDDMTVRITDNELMKVQEYEFDFVIGEDATQEQIFEEVRPLAASVLDGFNVCIFAYGQTGSGKTYTMEGPPSNRGINFRAVKELFAVAHERGEEYKCTMSVSILEVYNDKAFDLQAKRVPCKIRWGNELGVVIEPLTKHVVTSVDDVQSALELAYQNRSVAGTDCNAHSSRSHCILTVYINATNTATQSITSAKLHLIDLAGSERVKNSGVEGDRLKEATHINTSLTHLKTVINALANKNGHVAYRNSTLTSMLQDSLGGNCKCLMFANVSSATHNVPESICTMKYAAEARKVEIGKVSANVKKTAPAK
jgi:kinesin family protein C2/C3